MKFFRQIFVYCLMVIITLGSTSTFAGSPLWTLTPLTATTITVPANSTAIVQYIVTNQSSKSHTLVLTPITGMTQLTAGAGICSNPFMLAGKASCTLSLQVNGSALNQPITNGPIICAQGSALQCYRPSAANLLHITQAPVVSEATITVSGSPLTLSTNGSTGILVITNTSLTTTAENITSNFTGTALDGNVTETGNTCASLNPSASCTLTYTPGSTAVALTSFPISGSNTNTTTADMQIDNSPMLSGIAPSSGTASGGTGVTLTGTALTGATSVTFGGVAATSVNVVNSTTVTAVTPAHAAGVVDVEVSTPGGSTTLLNGYTYLVSAVGQSAYGGTIACLNGGLNNLIAAIADNSVGIEWGGFGVTTNATSTTDGSTNTATIVTVLGNNSGVPYAAQLCDNYEIDSQGNTPCEPGNTCYSDWYLPADNNTTASGQLNCLYNNRVAIGGFTSGLYWSSTEHTANNGFMQDFGSGSQASTIKSSSAGQVRCVRNFTP